VNTLGRVNGFAEHAIGSRHPGLVDCFDGLTLVKKTGSRNTPILFND